MVEERGGAWKKIGQFYCDDDNSPIRDFVKDHTEWAVGMTTSDLGQSMTGNVPNLLYIEFCILPTTFAWFLALAMWLYSVCEWNARILRVRRVVDDNSTALSSPTGFPPYDNHVCDASTCGQLGHGNLLLLSRYSARD